MHYGGIDEAGYGPMLGPLCVGAAVLRIEPSPRSRPCLWSMLDAAVTRGGRDRRRRIAIDDSKRLKGASSGRTHPLTNLERGVLCMLASTDADRSWLESCTDLDLLQRLGTPLPEAPWFAGDPIAIPLGTDSRALRLDAKCLQRTMQDAGVSLTSLRVAALDVAAYNVRVRGCGSKSRVNFETAAGLAEEAWSRSPGLHLVMDRHGGRQDYTRDLRTSWPEANIERLAGDEESSDYRLERPGGSLHLHVRSKADSAHLPVALASMAAKLVRELLMLRLNRFFGTLMPDLEPTAGYVQDGRRWLHEVEGELARHGLERHELVRCR